ncbi:14794_t:CDS:1, partial [Gigaspora rosea]
INSVNNDETELLFEKILPLLDKKVRGSLKVTENFENEDLIAYLDMTDKITI